MKPLLVSMQRIDLTIKSRKICRRILQSISLDICEGECLGLVGESGSGKTSLANILAGLTKQTNGDVILSPRMKSPRSRSRSMQMIFQNVSDSLNPKMTLRDIILEPLVISGMHKRSDVPARFKEIMDVIELPTSLASAYPKELSGGQKQRVSIGRSLIVRPKLLICDEPLSSLDSVRQAHIMKIFRKVKKEFEVTLLFISHDLTAVYALADRIAVIYKGTLVEVASKEDLFFRPQHPYTRSLLRMIPEFCYDDFPYTDFPIDSSDIN